MIAHFYSRSGIILPRAKMSCVCEELSLPPVPLRMCPANKKSHPLDAHMHKCVLDGANAFLLRHLCVGREAGNDALKHTHTDMYVKYTIY